MPGSDRFGRKAVDPVLSCDRPISPHSSRSSLSPERLLWRYVAHRLNGYVGRKRPSDQRCSRLWSNVAVRQPYVARLLSPPEFAVRVRRLMERERDSPSGESTPLKAEVETVGARTSERKSISRSLR
jgi:hypothetical protein